MKTKPKVKNKKVQKTKCSRGHTFIRGMGVTTCPKCWPGKYKDFLFHKDGTVWGRGKTVKGKMEGRWVWYRKDGVVMRSGSLKSGKQIGKWTTYDKSGKVYKVTEMGE